MKHPAPLNLASSDTTPALPTIEELVSLMGPPNEKVVESCKKVVMVSNSVVDSMSRVLMPEAWGSGHYALKKLLAVRITTALHGGAGPFVEYGRDGGSLLIHSGIVTDAGLNLDLVLRRNRYEGGAPLALASFVESDNQLPGGGLFGEVARFRLPANVRVSIAFDHLLRDRGERLEVLGSLPLAAKKRCVEGALAYSLRHELAQPFYYQAGISWGVPLFLEQDDVSLPPDLVVAVDGSDGSWRARTWLPPSVIYAGARALVSSPALLKPWLLAAWSREQGFAPSESDE